MQPMMRGDALVLIENLHGKVRDAHVDGLVDVFEGNGVVHPEDLHMVIELYPG